MALSTETKAASIHYAGYYGDIRRHLSTEFASETKWLTASLFALNAGGITSLSGRTVGAGVNALPILLFWLGILSAFAYVNYSFRKTRQFVSIISSLEEQYVLGSVTSVLNGQVIAELENQKNALTTKLSTPLSVCSFMAFTAALLAIWLAK